MSEEELESVELGEGRLEMTGLRGGGETTKGDIGGRSSEAEGDVMLQAEDGNSANGCTKEGKNEG